MNHNDLLAKPYLLPFNPIVLSFMTASQLRNNFDIKDNGTSINVSLRLELKIIWVKKLNTLFEKNIYNQI